MGKHNTLLRWVGSKKPILPELLPRVPHAFNTYYEPFAGSAALFFALRPQRSVIGDINQDVISFYSHLRDDHEGLFRTLSKFPASSSEYYTLRSTFNQTPPGRQRAALFFYLNRHCFNGVYRTNAHGHFNVPLGKRFGPVPNKTDFSEAATLLRGTRLLNCSYEITLSEVRKNDFVYIDPPYFHRTTRHRGEFSYQSFGSNDLYALLSLVDELVTRQCYILFSYKHTQDLKSHFKHWNYTELVVPSRLNHTGRFPQTSEALISNY